MNWRDAFELAARSVLRRFGRAVLTVAAVALAAALLTALLTIASTAETRVLSELAKGGPLTGIKVAAAAPNPSQVDNDNPAPGAPRDLDEGAVRRIAALPDVASILPVVSVQELVVPPANPVRPGALPSPTGAQSGASPSPSPASSPVGPFFDTVVGVDLSRAHQLPITVLVGRLPEPGSSTEVAVTDGYLERLHVDRKHPGAVLGTELEMAAPRFFPSLGDQTLRGRWTRQDIVGVVAQEAGQGEVLASIQQVRRARAWSQAGGDGAGLQLPTSAYSGLLVVAKALDRIGPLRHQITAIGYSTSAPENLIASVQRYLHVVEIVLSGIGAIALIIASLGIASALLAAIRERRHEIGVLKAIGARDRDILRVFLIEGGLMGVLGGVAGTLAGWLVARAIGSVVNRYLASQGLAGVTLNLPPLILLAGIIGSTLLSLGAAAIPSMRAAHLPAREAVGSL